MLGGNKYKTKKWADYVNADKLLTLGKMPPTYFITSTGDSLALAQTLKAEKAFREYGVETKLLNHDKYEGKALPHVYAILYPDREPGNTTIDSMLEFFKAHSKVNS
jgi:hypothetical protein